VATLEPGQTLIEEEVQRDAQLSTPPIFSTSSVHLSPHETVLDYRR
jgi:hypothetical protein